MPPRRRSAALMRPGPLVAAALFVASSQAAAFVGTAVGGHPGELDVHARFLADRGKIEPTENQASWQRTAHVDEYTLGVGYTWGDVGPLSFFSTRLEATYVRAAEEKNDPDVWFVGPPGSRTPADGIVDSECSRGAEYLGSGVCRFYPEDDGTIVTGTVSFAVLHDPKFAFGLFARGSVPLALNLEKYSSARFDYFAGGWQAGVHLLPWLDYESVVFIGSGTRPFGDEQNGVVALNNLFAFKAKRWLLPWKAGVKVGPYVEGDLHERSDARYDAAYGPQVLPQPGGDPNAPTQFDDRVRAARFAVAILPYFLVTDHVAVELGYVQKFFGYDAKATQAYFAGVRGLVNLGD